MRGSSSRFYTKTPEVRNQDSLLSKLPKDRIRLTLLEVYKKLIFLTNLLRNAKNLTCSNQSSLGLET
jgi:hypothetical protein